MHVIKENSVNVENSYLRVHVVVLSGKLSLDVLSNLKLSDLLRDRMSLKLAFIFENQ